MTTVSGKLFHTLTILLVKKYFLVLATRDQRVNTLAIRERAMNEILTQNDVRNCSINWISGTQLAPTNRSLRHSLCGVPDRRLSSLRYVMLRFWFAER